MHTKQLDSDLEVSKQHKWILQAATPEFFESKASGWHTCRVCQLTPLDEPAICELCQQHEAIGRHLPYTIYFAYVDSDRVEGFPSEQIVAFPDSPFPDSVALVRSEAERDILIASGHTRLLSKVNDTNAFTHDGCGSTFRFLGNAAPRATRSLSGGGLPPVQAGDVLHFEAIAELSRGAKRIGVMKADVDFLGLVFGEGLLEGTQTGLRPTISRVAAMSSMLDLFFSGQINRICKDVSNRWKAANQASAAGAVDSLFYILYSGGDDLFVIGPWDAVLELAAEIETEFRRYCCQNANITLSTGYVQVKPRFPVQKFAELVDEAERMAKDGGRNRICVFNQVVPWDEDAESFAALRQLSNELTEEIESNSISRGLIVDLGEVFRQHFPADGSKSNPMWTPRLFYTFARRLTSENRDRFGNRLMSAIRSGKILVPVSIVSLITRKE